MKHSFKRVFLLILALALTLVAVAVPTLAEDGQTSGGDLLEQDKVVFTKYLRFNGANMTLPESGLTFTFSIVPADGVPGSGTNSTIHPGVGEPTISDATFHNSDFDGGMAERGTKVTIDFGNVKWPGTGIYAYKITENAHSSIPGLDGAITFDKGYGLERWLYVMVIRNSTDTDYEIETTVMTTRPKTPSNDASDSKIDVFRNELETHNLIVAKKVVGNGADKKKDEFEIVVTLYDCPEAGSAHYIKTKQDDTTETGTVDFSTAQDGTMGITVPLKHGERVQFYALPKSVTYAVAEILTAEQIASGYQDPIFTVNGISSPTTPFGPMTDQKRVEITNTKTINTPTGLFMDYAPYALLVLVAIAAAFLFLRRRSTRDDR